MPKSGAFPYKLGTFKVAKMWIISEWEYLIQWIKEVVHIRITVSAKTNFHHDHNKISEDVFGLIKLKLNEVLLISINMLIYVLI